MGCGSCQFFNGLDARANVNRGQNLAFANNAKGSKRSRRANRRANRAANNNVVVDHGFNKFSRNGSGCCGCGCLTKSGEADVHAAQHNLDVAD